LNDGIEFLITDLALASRGIPSFTLSSLSLLSPVLESHPPSAIVTHAEFVPQLLELIHDSVEGEHHTVIYVGELKTDIKSSNVKVISWEQLEREGAEGEPLPEVPKSPNATFSVSFFTSLDHKLECAHITHQNITAGVAAARTLLPLTSQLSPLDTLVSAHSLSTAYGRAVAYTAIYEGTSFATTDSTKIVHATETVPPAFLTLDDLVKTFTKYPIPSPTVLFIKPQHLAQLAGAITTKASESTAWPLAHRHKRSALSAGFISKDSLWDRLVLDAARADVMGAGAGTVRGVIVASGTMTGAIVVDTLVPAQVALSVPLVRVHAHPAVVGPATASHALDVQMFPPQGGKFANVAHGGPPAINVEAKLIGVDDEAVEKGGDPEGELWLRGPSVAKVEVIGEETHHDEKADGEEGEWLNTGEQAKVITNGCFLIAAA
jgi:long-chain acyl-CoA synthetase